VLGAIELNRLEKMLARRPALPREEDRCRLKFEMQPNSLLTL
jgi:hypothetical protein